MSELEKEPSIESGIRPVKSSRLITGRRVNRSENPQEMREQPLKATPLPGPWDCPWCKTVKVSFMRVCGPCWELYGLDFSGIQ
jgi:hypothetical protein